MVEEIAEASNLSPLVHPGEQRADGQGSRAMGRLWLLLRWNVWLVLLLLLHVWLRLQLLLLRGIWVWREGAREGGEKREGGSGGAP